MGALRFATTTGLEQTVNSTYFNGTRGTYNGIRVLSREFYGSADAGDDVSEPVVMRVYLFYVPSDVCLKEYLEDATTASTALGYSDDNCNYDPR